MKKILTYGKQYIDKKDLSNVLSTLRSDYLTTGPLVEKFELAFQKKFKVKHAITCSNGTAALHLALLSIGVKKGDIIILPVINFIASINMAHLLGAKIFLADVDKFTGQMKPENLIKCIKLNKLKKIKAVITMYNGGAPNNHKEFYQLKKKYNFILIEDACHALGAKYSINKNLPVGSCKYSDLATFSFHPVKSITTGEGGMVSTNNTKFYKKLNRLKNHGIFRKKNSKRYHWDYKVLEPGYNYRLSDINCSLGLSQLSKIDKFMKKRKYIFKLYNKNLKSLGKKIVLPKQVFNQESANHLYIITLDSKYLRISRDQLIQKLFKVGIISQVHYIPITNQPFYKKFYKEKFSNANFYFKNAISLPIHVNLKENDIQYICKKIKKFLN